MIVFFDDLGQESFRIRDDGGLFVGLARSFELMIACVTVDHRLRLIRLLCFIVTSYRFEICFRRRRAITGWRLRRLCGGSSIFRAYVDVLRLVLRLCIQFTRLHGADVRHVGRCYWFHQKLFNDRVLGGLCTFRGRVLLKFVDEVVEADHHNCNVVDSAPDCRDLQQCIHCQPTKFVRATILILG